MRASISLYDHKLVKRRSYSVKKKNKLTSKNTQE